MKIKTILSAFAKTTLVAVIFTPAAIYLYERSQDVTAYFNYYGNVTTKDTFTYPDEITSYSFGFAEEPLTLEFVNELWCRDVNTREGAKLINTRYNQINDFEFVNELPTVELKPLNNHFTIPTITIDDMKAIRADGANLQWSMGDIKPTVTSGCYVTAHITTHTPIFGIPKTVKFIGNQFRYIVK